MSKRHIQSRCATEVQTMTIPSCALRPAQGTSASSTAGWAPSVTNRSAQDTCPITPVCCAVQLQHLVAARSVVQPVNVLRQHQVTPPPLLQPRKALVCRVCPYAGKFVPAGVGAGPVAAAGRRLGHELQQHPQDSTMHKLINERREYNIQPGSSRVIDMLSRMHLWPPDTVTLMATLCCQLRGCSLRAVNCLCHVSTDLLMCHGCKTCSKTTQPK